MVSLLALVLSAAAAGFPAAVTLKTADGVSLHAAYVAPAKAVNGVVFVHMAGRAKEDWQLLAEKLFRADVQVLSVDLRGHGANGPPAGGAVADYPAMVNDVRAAVDYLRARGCTRVTLVGAELGANLVINVAADDAGIADVVLLSPGADYKGVIATDAVKRYGDRPLLLVASADDSYGARSAASLDRLATGPHEYRQFEKAGKGTTMLNREPSLEPALIGWIQSHWGATGTAPPASGLDIKVGMKGIETRGPEQPDPAAPAP